jgi:hypothetical protein
VDTYITLLSYLKIYKHTNNYKVSVYTWNKINNHIYDYVNYYKPYNPVVHYLKKIYLIEEYGDIWFIDNRNYILTNPESNVMEELKEYEKFITPKNIKVINALLKVYKL